MKIKGWLKLRGLKYVLDRAAILFDRYGFTSHKAATRISDLIAAMAEYGSTPTFPTPGKVVQRHPAIIRRFQEAGAEIAVHGYEHLDLGLYSPTEARDQLFKATQVFANNQIAAHGFRCPYLRTPDGLLDVLGKGPFEYSSNKAIWWDVLAPEDIGAKNGTTILDVLYRFYNPRPAREVVSTPWMHGSVVEIPVSLPDDLQVYDGLHLGPEGVLRIWQRTLQQIHARGELFVLQLHPELAARCREPLLTVLRQAKGLQPPVWVAPLRDVSRWWLEKAQFSATTEEGTRCMRIAFHASPRATILAKGIETEGTTPAWGSYCQLQGSTLELRNDPRPFLGLPPDAPGDTVTFLQGQGYIVEQGESARRCAVYLDAATLARRPSQVELIEQIEQMPGPLVRFWRWPDGAKSALCVTGDLDALTLSDYAFRLLAR